MPLTVFPSPRVLSIHFPLYNQTLVVAVSAALHWHVSCDLPSGQNMSSVVLFAKIELLL
jgi:hypothetical protein